MCRNSKCIGQGGVEAWHSNKKRAIADHILGTKKGISEEFQTLDKKEIL